MNKSTLSSKFRVSIRDDVIFCNTGGQRLLLDSRSGQFYSLNETGSEIWDLIQKGLSSEEILRQLLSRHNVAPEVARADLLELVDALEKRKLVRVEREA